MKENSETPVYFYKIVPSAPPEPFPAEYPLSELDAADGFIHFSTAAQVRDVTMHGWRGRSPFA